MSSGGLALPDGIEAQTLRTGRATEREHTTNILAFPFHPLSPVHLQNNLLPPFFYSGQSETHKQSPLASDHLILSTHTTQNLHKTLV